MNYRGTVSYNNYYVMTTAVPQKGFYIDCGKQSIQMKLYKYYY